MIFKPGERQYRILLQSRDRTPFRVTRIETKRAGVQARSLSEAPGLIQTIIVEINGAKADDKAGLTVATDHPTQATVTVPIIVLD